MQAKPAPSNPGHQQQFADFGYDGVEHAAVAGHRVIISAARMFHAADAGMLYFLRDCMASAGTRWTSRLSAAPWKMAHNYY